MATSICAQALRKYRTVITGVHTHYNAGRPSPSKYYYHTFYNTTYTAHGIVTNVEDSPLRAYFIDTPPLPKQVLVKNQDPEKGVMNVLRAKRSITFGTGDTPITKFKLRLNAIDADAHILRDTTFRFQDSPKPDPSCLEQHDLDLDRLLYELSKLAETFAVAVESMRESRGSRTKARRREEARLYGDDTGKR